MIVIAKRLILNMIETDVKILSKTAKTLYWVFDTTTILNFVTLLLSKLSLLGFIEEIQSLRPYSESAFFYVIGFATVIWSIFRALNEIKRWKNNKKDEDKTGE